jgi:hypothetical protein
MGPLGCYLTVITIKDEGFASIFNFESLLIAACGPATLALASFTVWNFLVSRKDLLTIYERGFQLSKGKRLEVWRWEEIEEIRHVARPEKSSGGSRYDHTSHAFIIRGGERKPLTMDEDTVRRTAQWIARRYPDEFILLEAAEEVVVLDQETSDVLTAGRKIQNEVNKVLLPEFLERIRRGEKIAFGPFEITDRELEHAGSLLKWSEVDSIEEDFTREGNLLKVETEVGRIVVHRRGEGQRWAQVTVSKIPNDRLFLSLANQFAESAA